MPIYDYRCSKCGEVFEFIQKHTDPQKRTCPKCNTESLEKQLTACSFTIKGGGVYKQGMSVKK